MEEGAGRPRFLSPGEEGLGIQTQSLGDKKGWEPLLLGLQGKGGWKLDIAVHYLQGA